MLPELAPIERRTLATTIMDRLLVFIRDDRFRPGDPLPSQSALAQQLGVSRPVLREAIQGLASVGILDVRPGSGCYVRDPSAGSDPDSLFEISTHEHALEVLEARLVLEVELAGFAALRATDEDLARIDGTLKRLRRTMGRGASTVQVTSDFHQEIAQASHNRVLIRMAQVLTRPRIAQAARIEHVLPDIMPGEYESHRALFDAIKTRDPQTAKTAMREHLELAHGWESRVGALRSAIEPESEPATEIARH